jgi:CubicO group peptidase (beta-lactamase class C family)
MKRQPPSTAARRALRAIVTAALLLLSVTHLAADPRPWDEIDRITDQKARAHLVPQIAVVVMRGDDVVHTFTSGKGLSGATTIDTPFVIGSLSKLFTATAVMQLVDSGRVQLDAPVQQYLPQFRVADEAASKQITVRHLLNQNSGLPTGAPRARRKPPPAGSRRGACGDGTHRHARWPARVLESE